MAGFAMDQVSMLDNPVSTVVLGAVEGRVGTADRFIGVFFSQMFCDSDRNGYPAPECSTRIPARTRELALLSFPSSLHNDLDSDSSLVQVLNCVPPVKVFATVDLSHTTPAA